MIYLLLLSFAVGVLLTSISSRSHYSPQHWLIKEYSLSSAFDSSALLVDVRPEEDFAFSHIPGALSLDPQHWEVSLLLFLNSWSPERPVIIYCGSHSDSFSKKVALKLLIDLPDAKIFVLKGGFTAWQSNQIQHETKS